ncbi:unnamed protein product [Mytilus coruscus]|uniref:CCHC-type domain-containing protein n=1 Tax=Mytilus coruscus TaxID=42192 RepID=A0A6J8DRT5_MYTCO|nr:unnamed protein product [Mytilus coruscus]
MNSYKTIGDLTFNRESIYYPVDWTSTLVTEQNTTGQDDGDENANDHNCFRCGSPGHFRKHCKEKSERQRRRDADRLRNFIKRKRTKSKELKAVQRKRTETSCITEERTGVVSDDDTLQEKKYEVDNACMVLLTGSSERKVNKENFLSNIKTLVGKKRHKSQTKLDSEANRRFIFKKAKKEKLDSSPFNLLNSDFAKRFFRTKNASCVELNTKNASCVELNTKNASCVELNTKNARCVELNTTHDRHLNTVNQRKSKTSAPGTLPTRSILDNEKSRQFHVDSYIEGINRQHTDEEQRTIQQLKKEISVLFTELQEMVKNI